jgi:hypothetical protein
MARTLSTSHRRGGERVNPPTRGGCSAPPETGLSKQEIANELFLSFTTIHSHTKSPYAKLDASSGRSDRAGSRAGDLVEQEAPPRARGLLIWESAPCDAGALQPSELLHCHCDVTAVPSAPR